MGHFSAYCSLLDVHLKADFRFFTLFAPSFSLPMTLELAVWPCKGIGGQAILRIEKFTANRTDTWPCTSSWVMVRIQFPFISLVLKAIVIPLQAREGIKPHWYGTNLNFFLSPDLCMKCFQEVHTCAQCPKTSWSSGKYKRTYLTLNKFGCQNLFWGMSVIPE